jgi:Xaa-Pro aminopeptidase
VDRLPKLQEAMRGEGVDLAVVGPSSNLKYLIGYDAFALDRLTVLLATTDSSVMVLPGFDAEEFVRITGVEHVASWTDQAGYSTALRGAIQELGLPSGPTVAIDGGLPFGFFLQLKEDLHDWPLTGLDALLMPIRMVKEPEEQQKMARAGDLVSRGLDLGLLALRPGRTEREVARDIEGGLREYGAESVELVVIAGGAASVAPHHQPTASPLERGDPVAICIVARVDGYLSDISQHAYIGSPSTDYTRAYDAVWEAQQIATKATQPGVSAEEVDRKAFEVIDDAGLGTWFGSRTGHGIGIDIVEPPSIWRGERTSLESGVAVIIGPGVYIPGKYGIRIDDTVIVGGDGPRILTRASRPLAVID